MRGNYVATVCTQASLGDFGVLGVDGDVGSFVPDDKEFEMSLQIVVASAMP